MSPEYSRSPLDAETAQQFADIRAGCSVMIAGLLRGEGAAVEMIVGDAAIAAAQAGDLPGFESRLDNLLAAPDISLPELSQVCLAGVSVGSERAYGILDSIVSGEKRSTQHTLETRPDIFDIDPLYGYRSGAGLANLFWNCLQSDTPPNAWIEKAAYNDMHRWALYFEYYGRVLRDGTPLQQTALSPLAESLVTALLNQRNFDAMFVRAAIGKMLELTHSPELQQKLFGSLQDEIEHRPHSNPLEDLHCFAGAIANYANGLGRQNGERYDPTLLKAHDMFDLLDERLGDADMGSTLHVAGDYITIHAALTRYSARSTGDLIKSINTYTVELVKDSPKDADHIYRVRDQTLRQHAIFAAKAGDFASARALIATMHADIDKSEALYECLKHVKETSDLESLQFDGLLLDPSEEPEADRIAAEARLLDDPAKIAEAMTGIAERAGLNLDYYKYIEELRAKLSGIDSELAERTTRQLLAGMREKGTRFYCLYALSWALIQSGDAEELTHAYTQITTDPLSDRSRLDYLHRLRQIIDEHYPDLPEPRKQSDPGAHSNAADGDPVMHAIIELLGTMEK